MGIEVNTFDKGLSTEFSVAKQPTGTYPYAQNIIRDIQGTVKSEPGTTFLTTIGTIFTNPAIIGKTILGDIIIYFVVSDEGSTILQLNADNTITKILHTGASIDQNPTYNYISTDLLNFHTAFPIDAQSRRDASSAIVVYFTDDNNIPRRINLSSTITIDNFDEQTTLFLLPSPPIVTDLEIIESGGLSTGLYKFAARLGTSTTDTTTFGQISQGIPVVNESKASGERQYDGAPPQTIGGKSINITIENIDLSYNFLEIAVITYEGEENVMTANIIGRMPIAAATMTFQYYDDNQILESILLAELIQEPIEYTKAKNILQKDNHLFLSNLEVSDPDAIADAMGRIAKSISTFFVTKDVEQFEALRLTAETEDEDGNIADWGPNQELMDSTVRIKPLIETNFNNYKEPEYTYKYKGYQRDEVYSFAIVPIFVGGRHGSAYHIPGDSMNYSNKDTTGSEITNKLRGWANDNHDVHHRMPSHDKSPYVTIGDNTVTYHILGVEFRNIDFTAEPSLTDLLEGYTIVRQRRNNSNNGIVSMQGIAKNFYNGPDSTLRPAPFNGKTGIREGSDDLYGKLSVDPGIKYDFADLYFSFYSADHRHGVISDDYVGSLQELKQINIFDIERTADNAFNQRNEDSVFGRPRRFGVFYNTVQRLVGDGSTDQSQLYVPKALDSAVAQNVGAFQGTSIINLSTQDGNKNIQTTGVNGMMVLKLATGRLEREFSRYPGTPGGYSYGLNGLVGHGDQDEADSTSMVNYAYTNKETLEIYNLYSYNQNVYGELVNAEYIVAGEYYFDSTSTTTEDKILNGAFTNSLTNWTQSTSGVAAWSVVAQEAVVNTPGFGSTSKVLLQELDPGTYKVTLVLSETGSAICFLGVFNSSNELVGYPQTITPGLVSTTLIIGEDEKIGFYMNTGVDPGTMTIDDIKAEITVSDDVTDVVVFGGDTFINRYNFTIGETGRNAYLDTRANIDTYIETRGNYEYRHYEVPKVEDNVIIEGTLPYAPKYKVLVEGKPEDSGILGIWNYDLSFGAPTEYNKQYGFENTINKYYPINPYLEAVLDFPNRVAYSLLALENEQFDTYRSFLTNNYHDIPKETGEITDMFEYYNTLYLHTPHSLWKTFVNEKTFAPTSSGEIVLGSGGLFPLPSEQIYTEEGGFAGTESKWGSINTPYGRAFIDNHQQKIFLMSGRAQLKEISDPYMAEWFETNLSLVETADYKTGYDPKLKRLILSLGTAESISYGFELQSWTSFHSYIVDNFATRDNRLIAVSGSNIYEMSTGDSNNLFGSIQPSYLHAVSNKDYGRTKSFRNLKWIQSNKDTIFSNIVFRTEDFTTGNVTPILVTSFAEEQNFLSLGQQHVNLVGGEYRMTLPPDNNPDAGYSDELFRPDLKGKYGIVELTFIPDVTTPKALELELLAIEHINVAE